MVFTPSSKKELGCNMTKPHKSVDFKQIVCDKMVTTSPRTDSLDHRTELLSPVANDGDLTMASESSWQLHLDKSRLTEKRADPHISCGNLLNTIKRQKRIGQYYKRQEKILQGFSEVDSFLELGILPGSLTEEEMKQLARNEKLAIHVSNVANFLLFIAKVYASVESKSMAVIASTLDSLLDLLSGFILWFTAHAMRKPNQYRYPIGKHRMQPVGIVVFASIMATLGLQVLFESGRQLVNKVQPDRDPGKEKWMIGIMVSVTMVKLALTVYCRRFKNEIVRAYAQDHFFDVVTNSIGLGTAVSAIKFYWWIDPFGAILIALYTIGNWANTVTENVWSLIARTAPPEYIAKLTYLIWNHHQEIKHIETVRAYKFGYHYFVEVHIVLPQDMAISEAHNIGESLEEKIEQLPEVERAFVHVDCDANHAPEHKQKSP
ncbi:hypothetical protein K2173_023282 [Erythroxylum novogranatense]|uniref:Cation efflux protein cytoplasmic domain-containing protein n=1 Tax=Erythroxylum novogranatense TaxID=1862640 RepID=A0AAV8T8F5_9ROSI|nr:hypothetical protein K2173_023282 [Erythroxylum novogranatense]